MNKILLASCIAAAMSVTTMSAQQVYWTPAASQALNMENNPGGLSSVEIQSTTPLKVNRLCQEYAVLEKNGEIVKQIPASNTIAVYTFDGFTKNVDGTLHITFWDNLKTSPYKYSGTYTVTIPAGYFYYSDGTLNSDPVSCTWGIDNPQLVFEPAIGSTVSELKTITIDFPGADKVEFVSGGYGPDNLPTQNKETRNIYYDYSPLKSEAMSGDENSDDTGFEPVQSGELVPVIDGTTATITMPENYESGIVTFTFRDGAFNVWYNGARVPSKSLLQSAKYTIIKQDADENDNAGYTITPEPGEVYQIPSAPIIDKVGDSETTTEAYFVLYPPKDKTIAMVAKASARLYQVIDGERQSDAIKTFVGKKYNEGNGIMFYIAGESEPGSIKLPAGNYQLVVAANSDYTNRNPELVYNYTFLPSEIEVATIITPSNETTLSDPIEKVTIEFPDAENVTLNSGTYAIVNLGTIEFTAEVALETVNDHQAIVITPSAPFAADGTYVFTISGSDLTVDGMNYPISISYELYTNTTGVNEVESQVAADVYSIDGRIVARNASLEALKALNPGLYIINGKKVLIRK